MKKTILIIEDDTYIRDIFSEMLEESDLDVTVATDGERGLACIEKKAYDLVLLDLMMPHMDGIAMLKALHEKKIKVPPIILLTNVAEENVIKEAMDLGASSYIIKSDTEPDEFVQKVKAALKS